MSPSNHPQLRTKEERLKALWIHFVVYVLVNAGLIALDLSKGPEKTWFYWPLGGWGIGLACHACAVFSCHRRERLSQATSASSAKPDSDHR